MTPKSTLIGSALDQNHSFILKHINTTQRRENKYIAQRQDNQIHHTNTENQNHKYVKITPIYYNEKEKQFGIFVLKKNLEYSRKNYLLRFYLICGETLYYQLPQPKN
jgi:hypothetical protein